MKRNNFILKMTLILALVTASNYVKGQDIVLPSDSTGKTIYTEVVPVDSTSKNELYLRAKEWFARSYNSSKSVIQIDDKEAGVISGKAFTKVFVTMMGVTKHAGNIHYSVTVYFKNNRYKYEIKDWICSADGIRSLVETSEVSNIKPDAWSVKFWEKAKSTVNVEAQTLINSLKEEMAKRSPAQSNDW